MLELREPVLDRVGLRIGRDGALQCVSRLLHQITDALTLVSTGVIDQEQVATQMASIDDTPNELDEPIGVHSASFTRLPAHTAGARDRADESVLGEDLVLVCDLYALLAKGAPAVWLEHEGCQRGFVYRYDTVDRVCRDDAVELFEVCFLVGLHAAPDSRIVPILGALARQVVVSNDPV